MRLEVWIGGVAGSNVWNWKGCIFWSEGEESVPEETLTVIDGLMDLRL